MSIPNAAGVTARNYATVMRASPSRLGARGKHPLGLDHFIQRQRALALWRDVVRSTASISDVDMRLEMRRFARADFEKHRHVTDIGHIRYLISTGKTEFDTMKGSLINSGVLAKV